MNNSNHFDIQKTILQMENDIEKLDIKIEKKKSRESKYKILQSLPFFIPLIRAFLLTIAVLLAVNCLQ